MILGSWLLVLSRLHNPPSCWFRRLHRLKTIVTRNNCHTLSPVTLSLIFNNPALDFLIWWLKFIYPSLYSNQTRVSLTFSLPVSWLTKSFSISMLFCPCISRQAFPSESIENILLPLTKLTWPFFWSFIFYPTSHTGMGKKTVSLFIQS